MRSQRLGVHFTSELFIWNAKVGQFDSGVDTLFIVLAALGPVVWKDISFQFCYCLLWCGLSHAYSQKQEQPVSQDFFSSYPEAVPMCLLTGYDPVRLPGIRMARSWFLVSLALWEPAKMRKYPIVQWSVCMWVVSWKAQRYHGTFRGESRQHHFTPSLRGTTHTLLVRVWSIRFISPARVLIGTALFTASDVSNWA